MNAQWVHGLSALQPVWQQRQNTVCMSVQVLQNAVRRIDLGGKALTNYLIELVSYRCGHG